MEKKKGRPPIKTLSCDEVCSLIQCCKNNDVQYFSYSGLAFKLRCVDNKNIVNEAEDLQECQEIDNSEKESLQDSEVIMRNEQVKDLIISDPEAYEKLLAQDELVDEDADT